MTLPPSCCFYFCYEFCFRSGSSQKCNLPSARRSPPHQLLTAPPLCCSTHNLHSYRLLAVLPPQCCLPAYLAVYHLFLQPPTVANSFDCFFVNPSAALPSYPLLRVHSTFSIWSLIFMVYLSEIYAGFCIRPFVLPQYLAECCTGL